LSPSSWFSTRSLHDALPILVGGHVGAEHARGSGLHVIGGLAELHATGLAAATCVDLGLDHPGACAQGLGCFNCFVGGGRNAPCRDRKSTRLNSSHVKTSYAV